MWKMAIWGSLEMCQKWEVRERTRDAAINAHTITLNGTSNTIIILYVLRLVKYTRHITLLQYTTTQEEMKRGKKNQERRKKSNETYPTYYYYYLKWRLTTTYKQHFLHLLRFFRCFFMLYYKTNERTNERRLLSLPCA